MTVPTFNDLNRAAYDLHAFAQAADALFDMVKTDESPAANSVSVLLRDIVRRADALAEGIDRLDTAQRKAGAR